MTTDPAARRRAVAIAGHTADVVTARAGVTDVDASVREAALGALERLGDLTDDDVVAATHDASASVRRRAAELAAKRPGVRMIELLADEQPAVVEATAWACGERAAVDEATLSRLIELATTADEPLIREASVAALGALGDERGVPAILRGCDDKPAVRRRAVLALAPFDGPEVEAAIDRALADRDWQVRQAAEDLRRD